MYDIFLYLIVGAILSYIGLRLMSRDDPPKESDAGLVAGAGVLFLIFWPLFLIGFLIWLGAKALQRHLANTSHNNNGNGGNNNRVQHALRKNVGFKNVINS
jgi:hypothetical protein